MLTGDFDFGFGAATMPRDVIPETAEEEKNNDASVGGMDVYSVHFLLEPIMIRVSE